MRKRNWQLVSVFAVGGVVACSSASSGPGGTTPQGTDGTATMGDHTTVFGGTQTSDVTVARDHLEFPAAKHADILKHQVGDVLIGDPGGSNNPFGFLRKVTGAPSTTPDGATIVVPTAQAMLQDAVKAAKFQASLSTPTLTLTGPVASSFKKPALGTSGARTSSSSTTPARSSSTRAAARRCRRATPSATRCTRRSRRAP